MLATLAPFADELLVYPGSDIRPQDGRYALSFADPDRNSRACASSAATATPSSATPTTIPLSSRFDEMDAVVIFDDVEIPSERVFLDGDTIGYSEVITDTGWRGHIMHQAFTRAWVKLYFALGLGPPHRQRDGGRPLRPHPGEARADLEHERAGPLGARGRRGGRRA